MSDAGALPEILAMMAAASRYDGEACRARAGAAQAHLSSFHPARIELEVARCKANDRDFEGVWLRGQQATRLLTAVWPPAPSALPPYPAAQSSVA